MRTILLFFILIVALFTSLPAQFVRPDARFDSLRNALEKWVDTPASPSVSIAVSHNGKVVWHEAFGWQDTAKTKRVSVNTLFPIASITKTMTATAIMQLREQDKLKLSDPVEQYLGHQVLSSHFPLAQRPTILNLLHHTAGMDMYFRNVYLGEQTKL